MTREAVRRPRRLVPRDGPEGSRRRAVVVMLARASQGWVHAADPVLPLGPRRVDRTPWSLPDLSVALRRRREDAVVFLCLGPRQPASSLVPLLPQLRVIRRLFVVGVDDGEFSAAVAVLTAALPGRVVTERTWTHREGTTLKRVGWVSLPPGHADVADASTVVHPAEPPAEPGGIAFGHRTFSPGTVNVDGTVWRDGRVEQELLFGGRSGEPLGLDRPDRLPGRTYFLGGFRNYYHWVVDVLLTLQTLRRTEVPDRFLVVREMPFHRPWLRLLGLGDVPLVSPVRRPVECTTLTCPLSIAGSHGRVPPHLLNRLRTWAQPSTGPANEIVYISRRNSRRRRLLNEAEVEDALVSIGARIRHFEELDVDGQLKAVRSAAVVVGPHGAGLTNLLFAPAGCGVVEVTNPGQPTVFRELAGRTGLAYRVVTGLTANAAPRRDDETWTVDPAAVVDAVRAVAGVDPAGKGAT